MILDWFVAGNNLGDLGVNFYMTKKTQEQYNVVQIEFSIIILRSEGSGRCEKYEKWVCITQRVVVDYTTDL